MQLLRPAGLVVILALSVVALLHRGRLQAYAAGVGEGARRGVGRPAPELPLKLPTLDDKPARLAELRGRPVLLHFWTFGCGNCKRMLPQLARWQSQYAARGLQILGVHSPEFAFERARPRLAAFVAEQAIRWRVVVDDEMAAWDRFGLDAWPTTFVIDPEGIVRGVFIGDDQAGAIERAFVPYLHADLR